MKALVRAWALGLVRLFYPWRAVSGAARLPASGPVILVANHPNGLIDPLILRVAVGRPVAFLGKSTFWDNPVSKLGMDAFGALPVYRAHEADTRKNEATFAACHTLLREGGWLALFPEGKSHDETTLQPLKTGAARIALGAGAPGLHIVPVGLLYEEKAVFRSPVAVAVGAPIPVNPGDPADRAAVTALTEQIEEALGAVVLEAENATLWRAMLAVAHWTGATTLAAREARARELAAAWRRLLAEDPARAEAVVADVTRYQAALHSVGVTDPLAIEEAAPASAAPGLFVALALAPFALVGALLAWVPYRLVRPLATALARGHVDVIGTIKLLLGFVVLAPVYVAWAALAARWSPGAGLAMLVAGPLTGLAALRFDEIVGRRAEALRGMSLRLFRPQVALALAERRRELAATVEAGLAGTLGRTG